MNMRGDVGPPAEPPSSSATPPVVASPSAPLPPAPVPAPAPQRRARPQVARAVRTGALIVGGALLIYVAAWTLLFAVLTLGPLGLLIYTTLLGAILAVVLPLLLVRYAAQVRRPLAAIGRWIDSRMHAGGMIAPPMAGAGEASWWQRLLRLLGIHAVWTRTARLWVLLGLGVALALLWSFAALLVQVVTGAGVVTGTDLRVLNLVALLRTPMQDQIMYALTYLVSIPTVIAVTAVGVGIALLARRYVDALLILAAPLAGGLFVEIVKLLVARPRPPLADARIVADGFSFPSGHATVSTMLYGTLAYLLLRHFHTWPLFVRSVLTVLTTMLIFAIGLSRIYLGVHYPSDVLAGWAAGALWLVLLEVLGHVWQTTPAPPLSALHRTLTAVGSVVLLLGALAVLVAVYPTLPPPPVAPPVVPVVMAPDGLQLAVLTQLPHVTETIFGAPQEPVSLVFVGSQAQVDRAFAAAGWTAAERPEPGNDLHALWAGLTGANDPAGPVTPSFLADEPNVLAYSQEVGSSFDQRHHVRLWSTADVTSNGQNVWLATASFDAGVGLSHDNFLPTHHIAPNIDAERAYLVSSLAATGNVLSTQTFQLVPPQSGTNFVGDPFFTDGLAILLVLQ